MKIISKYKDYYDYLTGIYGVDPKIILDRRKGEGNIITFTPDGIFKLYICGFCYEGYKFKDKIYYGESILELFPNHIIKDGSYNNNNIPYVSFQHGRLNINPYESDINKLANFPILIGRNWNGDIEIKNKGTFDPYPKLSDFKIQKLLSSEEIYLKLVDWLTPKDEFIDNRTDKDKIVSNGFDLKHSFRNTK